MPSNLNKPTSESSQSAADDLAALANDGQLMREILDRLVTLQTDMESLRSRVDEPAAAESSDDDGSDQGSKTEGQAEGMRANVDSSASEDPSAEATPEACTENEDHSNDDRESAGETLDREEPIYSEDSEMDGEYGDSGTVDDLGLQSFESDFSAGDSSEESDGEPTGEQDEASGLASSILASFDLDQSSPENELESVESDCEENDHDAGIKEDSIVVDDVAGEGPGVEEVESDSPAAVGDAVDSAEVDNDPQSKAAPPSHTNDQELDWEARKAQLIAELENADLSEALDSPVQENLRTTCFESAKDEDGGSSITNSDQIASTDLQTLVMALIDEVTSLRNERQSLKDEIEELQMLLSSGSRNNGDGTASGAMAIAGMLEMDELVMQERERLEELQEQWEEKFRRSEIEASIERANLSRERKEVAEMKSKLEIELEQFKREERTEAELGPQAKRRWLAKLGLGD
ncbi:MAG: hypothetical protein AAF664_10600 [Planctomycetota bacterium]